MPEELSAILKFFDGVVACMVFIVIGDKKGMGVLDLRKCQQEQMDSVARKCVFWHRVVGFEMVGIWDMFHICFM